MIEYTELAAFVRRSAGLGDRIMPDIEPLGGRGSDRAYYRVRWGERESAILAHYDPARVENGYFAGIAAFLAGLGIPVPRLIGHDPHAHLILMEDLGAIDLYTLRQETWGRRRILYQATLEAAGRLHSIAVDTLPSNLTLMEGFSRNLYRWERDYFLDHFVKDVCHMKLEHSAAQGLEAELGRLADLLLKPPLSLVHRDLQSQNVMVRDGTIFLIDFQGMRLGSPLYDLGSLLFDPYVQFAAEEREELLAYYFGLCESGLNGPAFIERFYAASAQRLMQALGAYGFLGLTKGLSAYLAHVPAGLRNLIWAAEHSHLLPQLSEICKKCRDRVDYSSLLPPSDSL